MKNADVLFVVELDIFSLMSFRVVFDKFKQVPIKNELLLELEYTVPNMEIFVAIRPILAWILPYNICTKPYEVVGMVMFTIRLRSVWLTCSLSCTRLKLDVRVLRLMLTSIWTHDIFVIVLELPNNAM